MLKNDLYIEMLKATEEVKSYKNDRGPNNIFFSK